ncbi:hypothetical protein [Bacillus sp. B-jedd]|uniref:hypothetical protein n=1 Tax=Bacillus sp. B-jedd TaxID=1476857 RepID=UPI0005155672|nr:hypothetical protein [Bacillus sp. B-jedd]CEG28834.1 hypothetical protein BN1002_03758 [Bacillus sp. B-jedd]
MKNLIGFFYEKREPWNKFQSLIMVWVYLTLAVVLFRWLGFLPDFVADIAMGIMVALVLCTAAAQSFARKRRR